jgi:hypothetical protein
MSETRHTYRELEVVPLPDGVPELGIEAGTMGTIVDVLAEGRLVTVDVVDDDGCTLDLIDVYLEPEPHVVGRWRLGEE